MCTCNKNNFVRFDVITYSFTFPLGTEPETTTQPITTTPTPG